MSLLPRGMIKEFQLQSAFLKLMDNNPSNDWQANARIAQLSSTMTDAQINRAYGRAHQQASSANNKRKGSWNDPYKNLNSVQAQMGHYGALRSNDWMNSFPIVPPGIWGLLQGVGIW